MNEKELLSDVIYQLHKKYPFYREKSMWTSPFANFSASTKETISEKAPKFIKDLKAKNIIRENIEDLICILGEWDSISEGIFFTTKALYVNSPKNHNKKFRVRYDDITQLSYNSLVNLLIIQDYENKTFIINSKLWNVGTIWRFLEFSSERYNYDQNDLDEISSIELPHFNNRKIGELVAGLTYGNIGNASTIYGEDKFNTPRGHGFAAERANHLFDKVTGKDAKIVGDDNIKNGADRLVDGNNIQSKYCNSGSKCVSECFENDKFRYYNSDGTPMKIEVPSDKYEAAVTAMKERIKRGEVSGVTDPEEASNIIKKGHFTYEQVRNIAKAGTIESITYDAVNGLIIATSAFGVTAVLSFATSIWNGESVDLALKNAAFNGLKVGGTTFVTAVLAGQLSKAGLNSLLVGSSEAIIKVLGPKGSALLVNAFRSGKNIYGAAAMKSASKMLRGNVITGTVSVVVLSTGDVINIFRARISGSQLLKNVTNTVSSVAGGTAGWIGGAAAGAALGTAVPIVGNAVGAVVGGVLGAFGGGAVAGEISSSVMDILIEDDADKMVKIIEQAFIILATDYLLTQRETEHVIDHLGESLTGTDLKDMFASENKLEFAKKLISPHIEREIKRRKKIDFISDVSMQYGLRLLLEDMSDADEILTFEGA